jgi:excisionase family DNA binding protein
MKLISTDEAAERLGVSGRRVRQLIDEGKLSAQYVGGGYVIDESALEGVRVYGKPGRPPKPAPRTEKRATGAASARNGTSTKKKGGKKSG